MSALVPTISFSSRRSKHSQDRVHIQRGYGHMAKRWGSSHPAPAVLPPRGKELAGCSYLYSSLLYLPLYVLHTCILLPRPSLPPVPEPHSLLVSYICLAMPWVPRTLAGHVARELTPAVSAPSFSCPPFEGGTSMDAIAQSGEGHPRCRRRRKRIGPAVHTGGSQYSLSWWI